MGIRDRSPRAAIRYAVEHPPWRVYPDAVVLVDLDFGAVYGTDWASSPASPPSTWPSPEGSAVAVFPGERLRAGQPA